MSDLSQPTSSPLATAGAHADMILSTPAAQVVSGSDFQLELTITNSESTPLTVDVPSPVHVRFETPSAISIIQLTPERSGALTVAPGGGFAAHTHPGTLIVSIESGTFDLTQLDDMEMSVTRGATGASETMTPGVTLTLDPGDWFVEPGGMVHTGFNNGSEPSVVLLSGVVDPNQPLVQCIEGTPSA